ncbi:DapH/DapD/GlmU-related protein [Mariprofundus sp. KV]|uniref:DapH/DapD/GlmU-related protein n=1 Tax=Mariprofundus sp. KV TaxID=2608715 RepID=UPI001F50D151
MKTRLFYSPARLIRGPFCLRGRSRIVWGKGFTTGVGVRLDAFGEGRGKCLRIGKNVQLNDYVHIAGIESIDIGDDTLIASRVFISDHNHGAYDTKDALSSPDVAPATRPLISCPVSIGKKVWIGENVCILPGVTIGDGAIIGAGAVVTKAVPARSIAIGNPARVVRIFNDDMGEWGRV